MYKEIKSLAIPLLLLCSSTVFSAGFLGKETGDPNTGEGGDPINIKKDLVVALDDYFTVVPNKISTVEGNLITNDYNRVYTDNLGNYIDNNKGSVKLTSSLISKYGYLVLNSNGTFSYVLYENSPTITDLKVGDVVTDVFSYRYTSITGDSANATLRIQIIGNPVDASGNTIFQLPVDKPYDNVDVEFNNRSAQATPLNSARNIKGHLSHSSDKDWYKLASAGNEIITLEVCPKGSACYEKNNWVLYVLDSDKLTKEMEERELPLVNNHSSNHMYLAYEYGFFKDALIGVIDSCFGTSNSLDIGVGDGARDYLIAISSPLERDEGTCSNGPIVKEETKDIDGIKTIIKQWISVLPWNDDQYSINITGTGLHPLLSEKAKIKSSIFNTGVGELVLPKIRILDQLYSANLNVKETVVPTAKGKSRLKFGLTDISALGADKSSDAFQATYNPENQQVIIPRVTVNDNDAYSVIMQYHPEKGAEKQWLDVINYELIK